MYFEVLYPSMLLNLHECKRVQLLRTVLQVGLLM